MNKCPICSSELKINQDYCSVCNSGVVKNSNNDTDTALISTEQLVPRLGDLLIAKNLITNNDIDKAISFQNKARKNGRNVLLGEALVHLGFLRKNDLDNAITEQVFVLHKALRETNQQLEKRVEERTLELQNTLNKLKILNELKSDFISNISHELRTPMAHIIGYVDLLRDESLGKLSQDQAMALDTIVRANERIMVLLDNLLQFNGFTENTLTIFCEEVMLRSIISVIELKFSSLCDREKINFIIEYPDEPITIFADKEKIVWAIDQLIDNAIKFNHVNGFVKLIASIENDSIKFQIIDNGQGIPDDKIDLIFEAFVQLEGSLTRAKGGTGIGLTIVKQIIEAHNSEIKVYSSLEEGTLFEFSLPIL